MDKDKSLIISEGTRALARVGQHIGLVDKVLSAREDTFFKPHEIILRCETTKGFEDFVIDIDITELNLWLWMDEEDIMTHLSPKIGQLKKRLCDNFSGN